MASPNGNQSYPSLAYYLGSRIRENNLLGLSEDQIEAISKDVVASERITEIMSWCNDTLLLQDDVARELVLMRRAAGIGFVDDQENNSNPLPKGSSVMDDLPSVNQGDKSERTDENKTIGRGRQLHAQGDGKGKKKKKKNVGDASGQELRRKATEKAHDRERMKEDGECGCFGTKHSFWKNCMNCGRIFCEVEKRSPPQRAKHSTPGVISSQGGKTKNNSAVEMEEEEDCFFCGLPPSKSVAYAIAVEEGRLTEAAQEKNIEQFKEALARRDRLLDYEKHKSKRTAVIDDQKASLFSPQDAWISPAERQEVQKNAAEEERKRKVEEMQRYRGAYTVQLDFVNRNVSLGALPNSVNLRASSVATNYSNEGQSASTVYGTSSAVANTAVSASLAEADQKFIPSVEGLSLTEPESIKSREEMNRRQTAPLFSSNLFKTPIVSSFSLNGTEEKDEARGGEKGMEVSDLDDHGRFIREGLEKEEKEEDPFVAIAQFRAVAPSPSALHPIWYSTDGSKVEVVEMEYSDNAKKNAKGNRKTISNDGSNPLTTTTTSTDPSSGIEILVARSKRVQQDYFLEDNDTFKDEWISSHYLKSTDGGERFHHVKEEEGEDTSATKLQLAIEKVTPRSDIESASKDPLVEKIPYALRERDEGMCLSMHQPWASLLVHGIKTHEGREWSTNYRGRLWIHAASASPVDIPSVEAHYSQFMRSKRTEGRDGKPEIAIHSQLHVKEKVFPAYYPTKVLLGYVFVVDCLDRESYEAAYLPEDRQEACSYSFICVGATPLSFPLPMVGKHKIFTLDHKVHTAAKKQLNELAL